MESRKTFGHLAALLTIVIWGTTFISTKILLADFQPAEILFFRFVMGYFVLLAIYPHKLKTADYKQEWTFALAGLCGICLYYLLENIALTFTLASNVGVIISVAPFFTAILAHLAMKSEEKLRLQFFIGFACGCGFFCLGLLFHTDKENQQLRLSCHPFYTQDIFLWNFIYDTGTVHF